MSGKEHPEGPRPLQRSTAERLGEIVEAAERAVASVIDDAEAEARRYLAEAKAEADRVLAERLDSFAELTDSLIIRAEEVRTQSEALIAALEQARGRLGAAAPAAPAQALPRERPRGSHLSAVAPVAAPRLAEVEQREAEPRRAGPGEPERAAARGPAPDGRSASLAGARLLATQMAVSGSSREEIEQRLRSGFEIEDTAAILDAILGPED